MVAIAGFKRETIHRAVRNMYTAVATAPDQGFHFPTGRDACRRLGYSEAELAPLPSRAVDSFAGVGRPFAAAILRPGDHVLDIGAGSGTDALIGARQVGPQGKVYALDMTAAMRDVLSAAAVEAGLTNIESLEGDAEAIPLPDASVDAVTSNGVLNLVPDKPRAIAEIARVLKPGGRLQLADIALVRPVAERFRQDPKMWAECVVGAVDEERYLQLLRGAGFVDVAVLGHFDYFALSRNEETRRVAKLFDAHTVILRATKVGASAKTMRTAAPGAARRLAQQTAGVAVAVLAWLVCAGAPPLVAAFAAVGAGVLTRHAVMFPAYAGALGVSVWLLARTRHVAGGRAPFWLGLGGAAFAVVTFWLSLVQIFPRIWWWPYVGLVAVIAASIWSFRIERAASCVQQIEREIAGSPPRQRIARVAVTCVLAFAALYGLYKSVDLFIPESAREVVSAVPR